MGEHLAKTMAEPSYGIMSLYEYFNLSKEPQVTRCAR